jgi:hypothetical protein
MSVADPPRALGVRCPICSIVNNATSLSSFACSQCGGDFRSMHLAVMLLSEIHGGVFPTIGRAFSESSMPHPIILDYTGDLPLRRSLEKYSFYRGFPLLRAMSGKHEHAYWRDHAFAAAEDAAADVIMFRDILGAVPDQIWLIEEAKRICRDGGAVILQDSFRLSTEAAADQLPDGQTGSESGHGPDLIGRLRSAGFIVYTDHAASALRDFHPALALVAIKPWA